MGNYVILPVGNYVLTSALQLGNYVIADTAGNHARITEQVTGMDSEARGEFLGIARGDLLIAHAGPAQEPGAGPARHHQSRIARLPRYDHRRPPAPGATGHRTAAPSLFTANTGLSRK